MITLVIILGYVVIGLISGRLFYVFVLDEFLDDEELDIFMIVLHVFFWPGALIVWVVFGLGWVCYKIVIDPSALVPRRFRSKR